MTITPEKLESLCKVYHNKPLETVFQEELMSDLLRYMLELIGKPNSRQAQELLGTTIVLWAAFDKPFVELRHRAKAEDMFNLLCEMQKAEPEVALTLIQFTAMFGVKAGNDLAAFVLMFYNARKGE